VCREAIARHPGLYYVQTSAANYETMDRGATKGEALRWLSGYMGWDIADTVAFGDNNNDVTMIEAAGDGVVMENGEPQVKALADHIAPPAADGGVALYMRPILRA
jgi:hydroxymethylpyrimidine pyrophosphatase-like HAD family hydrolase